MAVGVMELSAFHTRMLNILNNLSTYWTLTEGVGAPINTLNGAIPITCDHTAPLGCLKEQSPEQMRI